MQCAEAPGTVSVERKDRPAIAVESSAAMLLRILHSTEVWLKYGSIILEVTFVDILIEELISVSTCPGVKNCTKAKHCSIQQHGEGGMTGSSGGVNAVVQRRMRP